MAEEGMASKPLELMAKRKQIIRRLQGMNVFDDKEAYKALAEEAKSLYKEAHRLGGLSSDEALALAHGH